MNRKYIVRLDAKERCRLEQFVGTGKAAAYRIRHANILLAVDESDAGAKMKDADAARAFNVSVRSIESLRKQLVEEGLDAALDRKKQVRPSVEKIFDGEKEARLIALACGPKPAGPDALDAGASGRPRRGVEDRRALFAADGDAHA